MSITETVTDLATARQPAELNREMLRKVDSLLQEAANRREKELDEVEREMRHLNDRRERLQTELHVIGVRRTANRAAVRVLEDHNIS